MQNYNNGSNPRGFWFYVAIGSIILFLAFSIILASSSGTNLLPFEPNFERTGQFGDSFGAISAIMAMIAAASAFATYRSQSEELARVRKSEDRRDASEAKRDFENTFFNLLRMYRELVRETDVDGAGKPVMLHELSLVVGKSVVGESSDKPSLTGSDAYSEIYRRIGESLVHEENPTSSDDDLDFTAHREAFKNTYHFYQNDLGHYFRLFYNILKLVDDSKIEGKLTYTRILRAMLSTDEMALIALNCIHGSGKPKLKLLVERYAMLHNMSSEQVKFWSLTRHFEPAAFGDRTINEDGSLSY